MNAPKKNPRFEIFKEMPASLVPSCLYIASAGNLTKVGYSGYILNRAKALMADLERKSGSSFYGIVAFPGAGAFQEEKGLIQVMKDRFEVASGNEYFHCHFDDAYEVVSEYCMNIRHKYLEIEEKKASRKIDSLLREIDCIERHMEEHRNYVSSDFSFKAFHYAH